MIVALIYNKNRCNYLKGNKKMKKLMILTAVFVFVSGSFMIASANILNDYFGVNLDVDGSGYFTNSWDPVVGQMLVEDWPTNADAPDPGPRYSVSEAFDIEAMYLDINYNEDKVYYSIVTSMPDIGFDQVAWYPGYLFRSGDIRFNIGDDLYVMGTFGGFLGNLYYNPEMTYTAGYRGFAERGNPELALSNLKTGGLSISTPEFNYFEYSGLRDENGYATYLMEGTISFADLGNPNFQQQGLSMTLGMSCNNDEATVTINPVPEPGTMILLGIGLIGTGIASRRRRKK